MKTYIKAIRRNSSASWRILLAFLNPFWIVTLSRKQHYVRLINDVERTEALIEQCLTASYKSRRVLPSPFDCRYIRLLDARLLILTHQLYALKLQSVAFLASPWNQASDKALILQRLETISRQLDATVFNPYVRNRATEAKLNLF